MTPNDKLLDDIRALAKEAYSAGRDAVVVELLNAYLQLRPEDAYMWFLFGEGLRVIGLNDEAERAFNSALNLRPERRAMILSRLARLYDSAGRRSEAESTYAEVCEDPEFARLGWVWLLRGANLAAATQLKAAEKCHRHALSLHEELDLDEAHLNLGYVLRAQGRYAEAAEEFQAALKIEPEDAEVKEALLSLEGMDDALHKIVAISAERRGGQ